MDNTTSSVLKNKDRVVGRVGANIKEETIDVSLITVGEVLYKSVVGATGRLAPKLTWYEKLVTSKEKRELAVMVGIYILLQAVKTKYRHYIIDAVSAYINFELQKKLVGGLSQDALDNMFSKLEKK